MSALDRDPKGHFISRDAALAAWLPEMLTAARWDELTVMLQTAARWCEARAASCYLHASETLTTSRQAWGEVDPEPFVRGRARDAERWFERKAILLEAVERLKGVK